MEGLEHVKMAGISSIPEEEYRRRLDRVAQRMEREQVDGMVFFSSAAIVYLTGSRLMQTERPMALLCRGDGERAMLVPRLEYEHAKWHLKNCKILCYPEYPGERHPMEYLADLIREMGMDKGTLGADGAGYPAVYGYCGPRLDEVLDGLRLKLLPTLITELKMHKSDFEIGLIRESARWSNYALALLQEYTKPGRREMEVSARACNEAAQTMMKTLGPRFQLSAPTGCGIYAGYRGQIGPHSYFAHAVTTNAEFRPGDMLGSGASANVLGYASELERVLFVGGPTAEQAKYYELAVQAQDAALAAIKPGRECAEVDREMLRFFEAHGLMEYWRHHTGHSLGTGSHGAPFFDVGDHTIIEPGMCFSIEPGIYVEGLGGFRLSDTVAVHADGVELLTYYSRDIDDLIC